MAYAFSRDRLQPTQLIDQIKQGARSLLLLALAGSVPQCASSSSKPAEFQLTFTGDARQPELSPDGTQVAYMTRTGDGQTVVVVQGLTDRSEPRELVRFEMYFDGSLRWSPNGTELYAYGRLSGRDAWGGVLVSAHDGAVRHVRSGSMLSAFSPDGQSLITASPFEPERVQVVDLATQSTRPILLPDSFDFIGSIDVSADGEWIALITHSAPMHAEIWTVHMSHARYNRVLEGDALESMFDPRWDPTGSGIYYARYDTLFRIEVSSETGAPISAPRAVLGKEHIGGFDVSRDGGRLALAVSRWWSELSLHAAPDSGRGAVRQIPTRGILTGDLSISPDGREIAFTGGETSLSSLYRMPLDGGHMTQLTSFSDAALMSPVWSPEGREIAFVVVEGRSSRVWRIAASGGEPRPMEGTEGMVQIRWAPGREILFLRDPTRAFRVIDPSTGMERALVAEETGEMAHPRYSPDGSRVAVHHVKDGPGLHVIEIADGRTVQLTDGIELPVGWSPEGDAVYARHLDPGTIVRVPLDGGPAETVFTVLCGDPHPWGVELTPDGRTFLCWGLRSRSDLWILDLPGRADSAER